MNSGISPNLIRSCGWASCSSSSSRSVESRHVVALRFFARLEAHRALADAALDHLLQSDKRSAHDEQDVGGVHRRELLVRVLAPALRRNVGNRAFQNLQQRLLHAFAGDIARNRGVLVLAPDLVDLVDVDDAGLGARHVAVGGLQQLENDVFHILAHVAGFGQRGRIHDREGHVQHLGQRLRQQRLAGSGRANQQNVGLRQLDLAGALAVHVDALVVVVNGHRELLLRPLLADHVLVQETS